MFRVGWRKIVQLNMLEFWAMADPVLQAEELVVVIGVFTAEGAEDAEGKQRSDR